jgi:hypothetical protein
MKAQQTAIAIAAMTTSRISSAMNSRWLGRVSFGLSEDSAFRHNASDWSFRTYTLRVLNMIQVPDYECERDIAEAMQTAFHKLKR